MCPCRSRLERSQPLGLCCAGGRAQWRRWQHELLLAGCPGLFCCAGGRGQWRRRRRELLPAGRPGLPCDAMGRVQWRRRRRELLLAGCPGLLCFAVPGAEGCVHNPDNPARALPLAALHNTTPFHHRRHTAPPTPPATHTHTLHTRYCCAAPPFRLAGGARDTLCITAIVIAATAHHSPFLCNFGSCR